MLRIGEFAQLASISTRTLRLYAELGLLVPALIDEHSGYRYYTVQQLLHLQHILALKALGLSLDEIGHALQTNHDPGILRTLLEAKRYELQRQVRELDTQLTQIDFWLAQLAHNESSLAYDIVLQPIRPHQTCPQCEACHILTALRTHRTRTSDGMNPLQTPPTEIPTRLRGERLLLVSDAATPHASRKTRLLLPFTAAHVEPTAIGVATVLQHAKHWSPFAAHHALLTWMEQHHYTIAGHLHHQTMQSDTTMVIALRIPVAQRITSSEEHI
jgi:DNA-binding transcriptional MerR regulator